MEDRRLEQAGGLVAERVDVPGQDPCVEPSVGPVGHAGVGEVEDERPAHERHEGGVAGQREADLARRHPRRRGQRARPRPRRHEDDHSGQGRYREREQVDETPAEPPAGGPQVAGRDHPVAPAVRPAEAKARSGPDPVQDDVEPMLSRREADVAPGPEGIALGGQRRPAVEAHLHAPAAGHPETVRARLVHAQRPRPPERPAPHWRQVTQERPVHLDRAGRQPADDRRCVGDLGGQTGGGAQPDDESQRRGAREEGKDERTDRTRRPLAGRQRDQHRQQHCRSRQRQRPYGQRRLGVDGAPAEHGEDQESDDEGEGGAERVGEPGAPHYGSGSMPRPSATRL